MELPNFHWFFSFHLFKEFFKKIENNFKKSTCSKQIIIILTIIIREQLVLTIENVMNCIDLIKLHN